MRKGQVGAASLRACAAGIFAAACLVPIAGARSDVGSEPPPILETPRTVHTDDRLDSQLGNVVVTARQQGTQAALRTARANGLDTVSGRIRVVVEATPADARDAVAARGGTVEATAGQLTEALVPPGSIAAVSGARGVKQVRAPYAAYTLAHRERGDRDRRGGCLAHGRCDRIGCEGRDHRSRLRRACGPSVSRRAADRGVDDRRLLRRLDGRSPGARHRGGGDRARDGPGRAAVCDLRRLRGRSCDRLGLREGPRDHDRQPLGRLVQHLARRRHRRGRNARRDRRERTDRRDPLGELPPGTPARSTGAARTPIRIPTGFTTSPAPTKATRSCSSPARRSAAS